jgi:hypothetical protein
MFFFFITITSFLDPQVSGASIARLTSSRFRHVVVTDCMEL